MATPIVLPKLGNTVESSIILQWHKAVGDGIAEGDILCEVETDKATIEVESPVTGTLLALFYQAGDEVPVMSNIAAVGEAGEAFEALRPNPRPDAAPIDPVADAAHPTTGAATPLTNTSAQVDSVLRISPRAKKLAQQKQVDIKKIAGSGPSGRIIERDVEQALRQQPVITPVAQAMLDTGEFVAPPRGSGARGRITKSDLMPVAAQAPSPNRADAVDVVPLKGVRKTIARRMLESLQTTAQLTLTTPVDARAVLDLRRWFKASPASINLKAITINDLILYAVAQTLPEFPELNTLFENDTLYRHRHVHLGFAVDTPRGLIVPVIRRANHLSMMQLADEAHRLTEATLNNRATPDDLSGGTFTVSNLGSLGIEVFTPILNPPQVGILGIGSIRPKPIPTESGYDFAPHMTLSLTINHQVVDGAPGARFLNKLAENLAKINAL